MKLDKINDMKLYLTALGVPGLTAWIGLNIIYN